MMEAPNIPLGFAGLEKSGHEMPESGKSRLDSLIRIQLGHKLRAIYAAETGADPQIQALIAKLEALLAQNTRPE